MAAGRVGTRITEAQVARYDCSPFADCGGQDVAVPSSRYILVRDGVDIVAASDERRLRDDGYVLVEL